MAQVQSPDPCREAFLEVDAGLTAFLVSDSPTRRDMALEMTGHWSLRPVDADFVSFGTKYRHI